MRFLSQSVVVTVGGRSHVPVLVRGLLLTRKGADTRTHVSKSRRDALQTVARSSCPALRTAFLLYLTTHDSKAM